MPTRIVVVGRHPIEAQRLIDNGQGVLRGVYGALLQRLKYLPAGEHGHRCAGPLHHLAADAGEADLEAAHVRKALHGPPEPAGGLRPGEAAEDSLDVLLGVQGFAMLATAGVEPPSGELPRLHAERNRAEQRRRRRAALVVAQPGVAGLHLSLSHRLRDAQGRHHLARLEDADVNGAGRGAAQHLGDVDGIVAKHWHGGLKGQRQPPVDARPGFRSGAAASRFAPVPGATGRANGQGSQQPHRKGHQNGYQHGGIGDFALAHWTGFPLENAPTVRRNASTIHELMLTPSAAAMSRMGSRHSTASSTESNGVAGFWGGFANAVASGFCIPLFLL